MSCLFKCFKRQQKPADDSTEPRVDRTEDERLGYWIGPYDVRIPNFIKSVPAEDLINTTYSDYPGASTEMAYFGSIKPSRQLYHQVYCEQDLKGQWWIKKEFCDPDVDCKDVRHRGAAAVKSKLDVNNDRDVRSVEDVKDPNDTRPMASSAEILKTVKKQRKHKKRET